MDPKRFLQFSVAGFAVVATAAYGLSTSQAATTSGFLSRNGAELMLNGKPYTYVSFNAYGMTGQETGTPYSRSVDDTYFASLPANSLTRTWAWKNNGLSGVETAVASAQAHNQMLILSLSEGAGFDGQGKKDQAWFASGYKTDLLPWVKQVVTKYKDSSAVGMWEIMNEPGNKGAVSGSISNATMKAFFDDVAATIKGIDKNHLAETGTMDANQAGTSDFGALHSGPNIDVASIHDYADEYEGGVLVSGNYTQAVSALKAAGVNKPIIVGEVGVRGADSSCAHTRDQRANIFKQKFDAYFKAGASGINIWNWYPTKYNNCENGESIYPGDPTVAAVKNYKTFAVSIQSVASTSSTSSTVVRPTVPRLSTVDTIQPVISPTTPTSSSAGFAFSGAWEHDSGNYTYENGAKATAAFTGTSVTVIGTKDAHHGTADVYIDGNKAASINEQSASRMENVTVFAAKVNAGTHTIEIVNTSKVDNDPWNGVIALTRLSSST